MTTAERVNGATPDAAAPPLRWHLFTVDAQFSPDDAPVAFFADIPQPALFQRCYVTQKKGSELAVHKQSAQKIARLVFLVADGGAPIRGGFALVPPRLGVPLDPSLLLECVVDSTTGLPWALWQTPGEQEQASNETVSSEGPQQ